MKDQVWLVGFMATGKSRVARPLAAALNWTALDIDAMVEAEAGEAVREIFEHGGEAAFRALESQAVERAAGMPEVVIATGGGAVLSEANRSAMKGRGFIVCLSARPETILARIRESGGAVSERPLLAGGDPLARISALLGERQPLYTQSDFIIQTDELTPDQVTHQILTAFREQAAVAGGAS